MFRKWMVFLLCTLLLFSSALAEGELRGYSKENGYVYVSFGRYPQVIDGGIPDDGTQAWSWRVSYQPGDPVGGHPDDMWGSLVTMCVWGISLVMCGGSLVTMGWG